MCMVSRSILAYCSKIHPSIFQSTTFLHQSFILRSIVTQTSFSSFCTLPSSLEESGQDCNELKGLNHKDWLAPNEVLKIFKTLKDPETVISVLDKVSKRKDYKPNEALYTLVINKLAQANKFDAIDHVMKRIKLEKNCRLSDEFFYNVIKVYGNVGGLIDKAIETLFDMPKYNYWPTVKTFNFVLNLLVSTKQFDVIHEVYMGAPQLGVAIDACCLNILVKGLCECGNLKAAFKVLDEFPKQGCRPNVKTFSTLMHELCEHGRVEEAFGLFERMERESVYPDTITFNILISGLRKQGKVEDGIDLLERMQLKGCDPNSGSYQEVLYGLLDAQKYVEAKEFMSGMISKGISPSYVSYKLIINGLCGENLVEDVYWVLKQMVQQGFVPKMGMWRRILESMFSGNGTHNCISLGDFIRTEPT